MGISFTTAEVFNKIFDVFSVDFEAINYYDGDYFNGDFENEKHKDRYSRVAWWLWSVSIVSILLQIILIIIRGYYHTGRIKAWFLAFAILVSLYTYVAKLIKLHNYIATYICKYPLHAIVNLSLWLLRYI